MNILTRFYARWIHPKTTPVPKGGETMTKVPRNIYTYEEIVTILDASAEGKSAYQISEQIGRTRTSGAISLLLKHFHAFSSGEDKTYPTSATLKNYFAQYVAKTKPALPPEAELEREAAPETKSISTDDTFTAVQDWFDQGGKLISDHIQKRVASEIAETQQELTRLRAVEAEYEKLLDKISSLLP